MPLITRLVNNSAGWIKPSGRDCKNVNPMAPLFEVSHGFGFEEWLFKPSHKVFINGEGYYLGYLEGMNNSADVLNRIDRIYLYTKMFKNDFGYCQTETKRVVGFLNHCAPITRYDIEAIGEETYHVLYRHMRGELNEALKDDERHAKAVERFDTEFERRALFNVKFKSATRYPIPPNGKNWEYLKVNRGIIQQLSDNFSVENVDSSLLDSYISTNVNRMELVLPPFFKS